MKEFWFLNSIEDPEVGFEQGLLRIPEKKTIAWCWGYNVFLQLSQKEALHQSNAALFMMELRFSDVLVISTRSPDGWMEWCIVCTFCMGLVMLKFLRDLLTISHSSVVNHITYETGFAMVPFPKTAYAELIESCLKSVLFQTSMMTRLQIRWQYWLRSSGRVLRTGNETWLKWWIIS